jgi:hypothetical protein
MNIGICRIYLNENRLHANDYKAVDPRADTTTMEGGDGSDLDISRSYRCDGALHRTIRLHGVTPEEGSFDTPQTQGLDLISVATIIET